VGTIGRGLALLQQLRLPLRSTLALEEEFEKTRTGAALVGRAAPQFAPVLEGLVDRLAAALPGLPRLPLVPCHGTFKLNHLLQEGDHLGLVDFDSMVLGDPLYDVANFTADLHYLEAHGVLPAGRAARLGRIFYDAWSDQVPWGRRDAVLDWYVSCLLMRKQALKPVKHLHPDAPAKIGRVLAAAQERLGG
jgi:aminoglycoside phosphotransferase (APT) family kinase protein